MRILEWGGYRSREAMLGDLFAGAVESVCVDEREDGRTGSLQIWRKSEGFFECEFHDEEKGRELESFWGVCDVPMKKNEVEDLLLQIEQGMSLREIVKERKITRVGGRATSWRRAVLCALGGVAVYVLLHCLLR